VRGRLLAQWTDTGEADRSSRGRKDSGERRKEGKTKIEEKEKIMNVERKKETRSSGKN
jgi:hypothetical protein